MSVRMQLFQDFDEAKEALEGAHKVMNSDAHDSQKLTALATAMRAEKSLEVLSGYNSDNNYFWEVHYWAAIELKQLFNTAENEARLAASQAAKDAYSMVMGRHFVNIHDNIKKSMGCKLTENGWQFTTNY